MALLSSCWRMHLILEMEVRGSTFNLVESLKGGSSRNRKNL